MKRLRLIIFGLFVATLVFGSWVMASSFMVWSAFDPGSMPSVRSATFFDYMVSGGLISWPLFIFTLFGTFFFGVTYGLVLRRKWLARVLLFPIPTLIYSVLMIVCFYGFSEYTEQRFYSYMGPRAENSMGEELMAKVEDVRELVSSVSWPSGYAPINGSSQEGEPFDATSYFQILTNISMRTGYEVDYVQYFEGMETHVMPSVRREVDKPHESLEEFIDAHPLGKKYWDADYLFQCDWSLAVEMNQTPAAYLELAALYLIGTPYSYSYDTRIIGSVAELEDIVNSKDDEGKHIFPVPVRMEACELDICPSVSFFDDEVKVSLLFLTSFGRFERVSLIFSNRYPHKLLTKSELPWR